jgi:hypothetical protein
MISTNPAPHSSRPDLAQIRAQIASSKRAIAQNRITKPLLPSRMQPNQTKANPLAPIVKHSNRVPIQPHISQVLLKPLPAQIPKATLAKPVTCKPQSMSKLQKPQIL